MGVSGASSHIIELIRGGLLLKVPERVLDPAPVVPFLLFGVRVEPERIEPEDVLTRSFSFSRSFEDLDSPDLISLLTKLRARALASSMRLLKLGELDS